MADNILKLSNGRKNISISVSNSRITLNEVSFTVAYLKSEVDSVLNVFLELYRRHISTFHITVRSSDCDKYIDVLMTIEKVFAARRSANGRINVKLLCYHGC